jgi:hypothetical protein
LTFETEPELNNLFILKKSLVNTGVLERVCGDTYGRCEQLLASNVHAAFGA